MEDPKVEKILKIIERLYEEAAATRDAYIEGYRDALDCLRGEMDEDDSLTPREGVTPTTFMPGQNLLVPLTGGEIPKGCKWDEDDYSEVRIECPNPEFGHFWLVRQADQNVEKENDER